MGNEAQAVVDLLAASQLSVTCAESCTGGMLSARLIDVPGVSAVYKCGYITYSNQSKRRILGVKKSTLRKHGAVSEKTAREMAKGAAKAANAEVSVAVTGIAGPDGGTKEKPVGLVYIACSVKGAVTIKECFFQGDRTTVRESTVKEALSFMQECIQKACRNAIVETY